MFPRQLVRPGWGDNRIVPHTAYGISSLLVGHYQYDMRMFLCVCKEEHTPAVTANVYFRLIRIFMFIGFHNVMCKGRKFLVTLSHKW